MSSTAKLTKKQKKALAFRERKGKGKAKSFDDLDDVPVAEDQDLAEAEADEQELLWRPRQRGRAHQEAETGDRRTGPPDGCGTGRGGDRRTPESEKGTESVGESGEEAGGEAGKKSKAKPAQRYILFVGNLKYATTKEAVEAHFSKCDPPPSVRLMTPKLTEGSKVKAKSKGFAFVEFSHRNALQQGLKMHQSELEGRKINVELTAGGGGKSEQRIEKVKQRNKELHEQRKNMVMKRNNAGKSQQHDDQDEDVQMERPQRYSTTSGVDQVPLKKRTWSIPENEDEAAPGKKRGSKKRKKRLAKPLGTGVNAIPVG
ncbi:uncharacterized protein BXZ73DRAFT_73754 [Epithele typhae]|uniref:uncharacterized protein n=1 Tax=Epithele typhae TaxID=378194 RepID=UPI002007FF9C|nr:uncharacterized protein BXZ73DRAFT_73754 [Epithele typhae]KAH9944169.1 hypothetical protein BXZ73DRAFT_73754 [Epithele typhae]